MPVLTLLMALDGMISQAEGSVLLALFAGWLGLAAWQALAHRRAGNGVEAAAGSSWRAWLLLGTGLAALILAGRQFVSGASGLAASLGIHAYVIGVLVVALGTSLPELVTTLLARLRAHHEVGLGTLLGSNLFNGLAIAAWPSPSTPYVRRWPRWPWHWVLACSRCPSCCRVPGGFPACVVFCGWPPMRRLSW